MRTIKEIEKDLALQRGELKYRQQVVEDFERELESRRSDIEAAELLRKIADDIVEGYGGVIGMKTNYPERTIQEVETEIMTRSGSVRVTAPRCA